MSEVPLFPLNTVLFPGGRLPLRIFEQRYMDMAKACLRDGSAFGVCLIREGREVGDPATPVEVGCLARIGHWDMQQLGLLEITALGSRRFRILERKVEASGLSRASIDLLEEDIDAEIPASCAGCVSIRYCAICIRSRCKRKARAGYGSTWRRCSARRSPHRSRSSPCA